MLFRSDAQKVALLSEIGKRLAELTAIRQTAADAEAQRAAADVRKAQIDRLILDGQEQFAAIGKQIEDKKRDLLALNPQQPQPQPQPPP